MANTQNAKPKPVTQPFLGLFFDRPPWQADPKSFIDCNNVRITNGRVTSAFMGWSAPTATLDGPVTLDAEFQLSLGPSLRVLGTPTDLYNWNNGNPLFITPSYVSGTASVNNGGASVTGAGTAWKTAIGSLVGARNNAMPGDKIYFGSNGQNSPAATWYTVLSVTSDGALTLSSNFVGTNQVNVPYTIRQLTTGDAAKYHWAWEIFPSAGAPYNSDIFFATNGTDALVAWNPAALFATYVGNMPFYAYELRRYKNLMIYGGLVQNGVFLPTSIANSDNGLPTTMAGGIAGQYVVSDGPYTINWLGILGNQLLIYMGSIEGGDVVSASFVGAPTNFIFTEVIRGRGPIASRLVAEFPDRHQFITGDGEIRYNGLFIQYMNPQVWRVVLQNFDRSRADRAFCFINQQFGDLQWAIPLQTDPAKPALATAYVEHYLEQVNSYLFKPITKRDFPFSASGSYPNMDLFTWDQLTLPWSSYSQHWNDFFSVSGSYPVQSAGDLAGNVYTLYTHDTQNGTAFTSSATWAQRLTWNERVRGLVTRVYPIAEQGGSYNLTVTLTLYNEIGAAAAVVDTQTMPLDYSGNRFTTHYRCGRLAQVSMSTPGPNQPWTLDGYDFDVIPGGVR